MILMYDSVNYSEVPRNPHAVAYYVDGHYGVRTHEEMVSEFPHARLLSISVTGGTVAECYDIESGDYSPDQAPELVRNAWDHGISRPCLYANLSTMPRVIEAIRPLIVTAGDRKRVRLWAAYYNGHPDIPHGYDGHQFTDRALGRNLDESILLDDFFQPWAKIAAERTSALTASAPATARVSFDGTQWQIAAIA